MCGSNSNSECNNNSSPNSINQLYRVTLVYNCKHAVSYTNGNIRWYIYSKSIGFNNKFKYGTNYTKFKYSRNLYSYIHHSCIRRLCGSNRNSECNDNSSSNSIN